MYKSVVVLVVMPILLFCSCKDSEQADSGAVGGKKMGSAKKADVNKLDNPAWSKLNQQARTELCV